MVQHSGMDEFDDGAVWIYRQPPFVQNPDEFGLCEDFEANGRCGLGDVCPGAHGSDELVEWQRRFEWRKKRFDSVNERSGFDQICEQIDSGRLSAPTDLVVHSETGLHLLKKEKDHGRFEFKLMSKTPLVRVVLLNDENRANFSILWIKYPDVSRNGYPSENTFSGHSDWCQVWHNPVIHESNARETYTIHIRFKTEVYGVFKQRVVFQFGPNLLSYKDLSVEVIPEENYSEILEAKETFEKVTCRWNCINSNVVKFQEYSVDDDLLMRYPLPRDVLYFHKCNESLNRDNYRELLHVLLYLEEVEQLRLVASYDIKCTFDIVQAYAITTQAGHSVFKSAPDGELFAVMNLKANITEDSPHGRLLTNSCTTILFKLTDENGRATSHSVYEGLIENKSKDILYIHLSKKCVNQLNLSPSQLLNVQVQFQLNRMYLTECHLAVDRITILDRLFPMSNPLVPWNTGLQFNEQMAKLNSKQKEAVIAAKAPLEIPLPPVVISGPFGTGKTYALVRIVGHLIEQNETNKILICTHSNSAADLYITQYLNSFIEEGKREYTPLRIYYTKRWMATVDDVVKKYCLINSKEQEFRKPTLDDVEKYRIIITTLTTSSTISDSDIPSGYFTHIIIDEAAQVPECEAIIPLCLADHKTRIILAGDHMQLSPEIFSTLAIKNKLNVSLLQRLYNLYPSPHPCRLFLTENYRSHSAIVSFASQLFYENKLLACIKHMPHPEYYPLTFWSAFGIDEEDKHGTFYNYSEVGEIVDFVLALVEQWPRDQWGEVNQSEIGIVTPYYDQVLLIRSSLRRKKLSGVSVERVLNVQGKQFRVIILSTVRTSKTLKNQTADEDSEFYGFLSDAKLLNTAFTRAHSLIVTVGDPISLCSYGKNRGIWRKYIDIAAENNSLYGIAYENLRHQLEYVPLKKYKLNPLAPEFYPRGYVRGQPMRYSSTLNDSLMRSRNAFDFSQIIDTRNVDANQHVSNHHFPNTITATPARPIRSPTSDECRGSPVFQLFSQQMDLRNVFAQNTSNPYFVQQPVQRGMSSNEQHSDQVQNELAILWNIMQEPEMAQLAMESYNSNMVQPQRTSPTLFTRPSMPTVMQQPTVRNFRCTTNEMSPEDTSSQLNLSFDRLRARWWNLN